MTNAAATFPPGRPGVPAPEQELVDLFEQELRDVPFPDVTLGSLKEHLDAVERCATEVDAQRQGLERARDALQVAQKAMTEHAKRALAYMQVFASNKPELNRKLEELRLAKPPVEGGPRKRRRRKAEKQASSADRGAALIGADRSSLDQNGVDQLSADQSSAFRHKELPFDLEPGGDASATSGACGPPITSAGVHAAKGAPSADQEPPMGQEPPADHKAAAEGQPSARIEKAPEARPSPDGQATNPPSPAGADGDAIEAAEARAQADAGVRADAGTQADAGMQADAGAANDDPDAEAGNETSLGDALLGDASLSDTDAPWTAVPRADALGSPSALHTDADDPVAQTEKVFRREFMKLAKWKERGYDEEVTRWILDNTVDRAADVLKSEALEEALTNLATRVLQSKQFQEACSALIKNLWNDLVNDPETTAQIVELLNNAVQHENVQKSVRKLVLTLIQDKEVYDELTRLLVRLGKEKKVSAARPYLQVHTQAATHTNVCVFSFVSLPCVCGRFWMRHKAC